MESFWEIVEKILKGLKGRDVSHLTEFNFDSEDQETVICFHTKEDGMLVVSVFDPDQWSLIEDMAVFMDKEVQDIVEDLEPNGINIISVDPKQF